MPGDGVIGLRRFIFKSSRLRGWRQRLFFFKLGNLGRVGLWFGRLGLGRFFFVEALRWIDGLTFRDHRLPRHGNASGADEIHFRTAELAAGPAPTGTMALEKRGTQNGSDASNVEEDGIFEVFP